MTTDHRPYIEAVRNTLAAAGLPVTGWETAHAEVGGARIELKRDDDRVVLHWHEAHGWEVEDSAYDDEPDSLDFAGIVDPPAIVLAALISESWTARNMLRAQVPDDRASALAAYAPPVEPEPTGPRPGQQLADAEGEVWTYVDAGREELMLTSDLGLGLFTQAEVEERVGPTTPVRDAADVMPAGEAAELEAATAGHDPADYVEAERPEPIRLCCGHPCPNHDHTCERSPQHGGFHRDAREKNTESCSWLPPEPTPEQQAMVLARLFELAEDGEIPGTVIRHDGHEVWIHTTGQVTGWLHTLQEKTEEAR